jgi:hypothetical protein
VQALIQGRASAWQKNLVLTPTKAGAGEAVCALLLCLRAVALAFTTLHAAHSMGMSCTGHSM